MKKKLSEEFRPSIYTDLAVEAREAVFEEEGEELNGIEMDIQEESGVKVTWVKITNENGEKLMGKAMGNYITIESEALRTNDIDAHEQIIKIMVDNISKIISIKENETVLIIGLGNWNVTPDALGPRVISKTLITRHIKEHLPDSIDSGVRPVAALSPGVMGITGIETYETVKGLVDRLKPSLIIAIDALASRSVSRINSTIQISDTGVAPGGGMGNRRKALNIENMGIPVIAIGVPTVVDAATLVNDTMDLLLSQMIDEIGEGGQFYETLQGLENQEKYELIIKLLAPYSGNMFVTPKEVDAVIDRLSNIIANALNISLHKGITKEDINRFMY